MQTLFDVAGLAVVAYGEVVGATGLSPNMNSGVVTARTSLGLYTVTLPDNKLQSGARDIMVVTPRKSLTSGPVTTPVSCAADDTDPAIKRVALYNASSLADVDFSFVIFRTIVSPPTGIPG